MTSLIDTATEYSNKFNLTVIKNSINIHKNLLKPMTMSKKVSNVTRIGSKLFMDDGKQLKDETKNKVLQNILPCFHANISNELDRLMLNSEYLPKVQSIIK